MKCEVIRNMISAYIDKDLNDIDKQEFENHLSMCPECKAEYESIYEITSICGSLEEVELPSDFRTELHQKLLEEKGKKRFGRFFGRRGMKAAAGISAAVLVIAIGIGSFSLLNGNIYKNTTQSAAPGAAPEFSAGSYSMAADMAAAEEAPSEGFAYGGAGETYDTANAARLAEPEITMAKADENKVTMKFSESADSKEKPAEEDNTAVSGRMVIKNGSVSIKVSNVDNAINEIKKMAENSGGYVESSQINNIPDSYVEVSRGGSLVKETTTKYADITIRVPAKSFEGMFNTVKGLGKLVNEYTSGNDITAQYRDTYTRAENLKIQEKSLQQLMSKANTVDEILKIETEINRVRTEIDLLTGDLKRWENLVQLSTIHINLTEVKEEELKQVDIPGIWGKAYNGFIGAINNIVFGLEKTFIFLVSAIPYLLILGVLGIAGLYAVRRIKKKK